MKKYKNGLVLGKFYGLHIGHLYLIDTAIENCDIVHVIACHNKNQTIPDEIRVNALRLIYINNPNVIIHSMDDIDLPQHDYECESLDEFYSHWVPRVYNLIDKLDVVFTSEDYGDDFARYLGIEHFLVDKERIKYPVSGTKIRENPFDNWEFIPNEVRHFFINRIAIMGPESTGKSTLTKNISNYFNTVFVPEYGRFIYENNGNKVGINDFIPISQGRQSLEDWLITKANKLIFCDTEDITTYIFSKMFCTEEEYKSKEFWFIDKMKNKFDLYILMKPDCRAVQDGTRVFLDKRQEHYDEIKKELDNQGCDYIEVGGEKWDDRFNSCIDIVKSKFNI